MPFALIFAGILSIVVGARGTYAQFGSLVAGEFTGKPNFVYWFAAIFGVGAFGYIDAFRTVSRLLLVLVLLSLLLSNKGFFNQFKAALAQGPKTPNPLPSTSTSTGANPAISGSNTATTPAQNSSSAATYGIIPPSWFGSDGNLFKPGYQTNENVPTPTFGY